MTERPRRQLNRSPSGRRLLLWLGWAMILWLPGPAAAETPLPAAAITLPVDSPLRGLPPQETQQVLQWAADWVRLALPASYEGDKDWGDKKRVYAGVQLDFKDHRLTSKRRWRELNHGRWIKYSVDLHDPAQPERLTIDITRAWMDDQQRIHFDALIRSRLDWVLQQERWTLGTRLWSVTVRGTAEVQFRIVGNVGINFDWTRIPPDVVVSPEIESSQLTLQRLKVDRISKIGGEVAEAFGELAEHLLQEEYLPRQQTKITQRLNRQLDRRSDRLRFSASDWLTQSWNRPRPQQIPRHQSSAASDGGPSAR